MEEAAPLQDGILRATPVEIKRLKANFRNEARQERALYRDSISQEWELAHSSLGDKENLGEDYGAAVGHFDEVDIAFDEFVARRLQIHDRMAAERRTSFFSSIEALHVSSPLNQSPSQKAHTAKLLQNRADE